jgi:CheY-like chemotaxis protein
LSHGGTSRVVLVVEDELIVRSLVALELRSAGWEVLETSTAEGAIEHLQLGHPVDVVVTDIRLAGRLSGWDVAEQFRAARVNLPIIYTSGNSFDRSRRVEGSLFFDKPYSTVAIVEACEKLA